ncbi:MAG TPA: GerMN domain-containing protein [Lachnospiraceae bacterium]|jgi:germination protein M|nr:GerMN domain-containing protein [Lachnospiraceae bacterium]
MKKIRFLSFILASALTLSLAGCGSVSDSAEEKTSVVYCLDNEGNGLAQENYNLKSGVSNPEGEIEEFASSISEGPKEASHKSLLPKGVTMNSHVFLNGILTLDFSDAYNQMGKTREVLVRAGIVRTFVQIDSVKYVIFTVSGQPIRNSRGVEIGMMNADSFIENSGKQINTYQHSSIKLYYASADGKSLKQETRSIYYSSNKPLEWAIVERLIAGPKVEGNYPAIPANTQIISVSTSDNICYVNLSASFSTEALNIDERIPVYAIVDSLVDNCQVKAVQLAIAGDTDIKFRNSVDLSNPLTEDLSLISD